MGIQQRRSPWGYYSNRKKSFTVIIPLSIDIDLLNDSILNTVMK